MSSSSTGSTVKLSIMMFLQFFIWGSWYVTAPNYLSTIGFGAGDFGWTYAVGPIAGMISPFFVGMIADRFFPAQMVMGVMHLIGAGLMFYATRLMQAESPVPGTINWIFFGHMLTYYPTLALSNTLAMKNLTNSEKQFPLIRVFGTLGWIVAGLALTFLKIETTINMFYMSAGAALLLGLLSFALPHTPPVSDGKTTMGQIFGVEAFALFKNRSYLVFMVASMLICIPLAFYYQIASRVVEMVQLPIGLTMSTGQISEVFFMLIMPFFFTRLGVKWMLAVGMLAWVLRYALFAFGAPQEIKAMIFTGIILHGICYDFFFVTGQIYTDQVAPKNIRAQAQGLLVFFTLGLGMFVGAKIAGSIETQHTPPAAIALGAQVQEKAAAVAAAQAADAPADQIASLTAEQKSVRLDELRAIEWKPLWGKPAIFAALVLVLFVLFFKGPKRSGAVAEPLEETQKDYNIS